MISIKKMLFAAFIVFAFTGVAFAQEEGSVLTALSLVDDFDAALKGELSPIKTDNRVADYLGSATKAHEKAVSDIKALRWSEAPSAKRFNRLYKMYEDYAKDVLEGLDKLSADASGMERKTLENAAVKLTALKKKSLEELKQSSRHRQKSGDSRIVPVIDRSPYDDTPGSQKGLWER